MHLVSRLMNRLLPALLMATSVVLLSAGLFAYAPLTPEHATPSVVDAGDPTLPTAPTAVGPSPTATSSPTTSSEASPSASPSPIAFPTLPPLATWPPTSPGTPSPSTAPPTATLTPPPSTATPTTRTPDTELAAARPYRATRVVVPSMGIDLPVISSEYRSGFPLCNVAMYLASFSQPGRPGTTYLYAHARDGMFLPLLEESKRNNGRGMIGTLVEVYSSDDRLHLYEIYVVKRHATDLSLAYDLPRAGHQVILQTSEGPRGTIPKLQVAARPLGVVDADPWEARPKPRPRVCG